MALVLVVDDEPDVREFVAAVLELAGHEVRTAANGREALDHHRARPADLVIMDIFMPEKEGLETIMELREQFPGVRIIAISGGGRTGDRNFLAQARYFGAARSLAKPFSHEELLNAVEEVLADGGGVG